MIDERWNYQIERFIAIKSLNVVRTMPTMMDGVTILECVFTDAPFAPDKASQGRLHALSQLDDQTTIWMR